MITSRNSVGPLLTTGDPPVKVRGEIVWSSITVNGHRLKIKDGYSGDILLDIEGIAGIPTRFKIPVMFNGAYVHTLGSGTVRLYYWFD